MNYYKLKQPSIGINANRNYKKNISTSSGE